MAWTNIANANLQVGAPLRSVDILALRDNVSAVPNGDSGAPRIKAAALDGAQSGAAPIFGARAWVNFSGPTAGIRAGGNVSSVTKNSTGQWNINFATPMQDANYCVSGMATATLLEYPAVVHIREDEGGQTANGVRILVDGRNSGFNEFDSSIVCVSIHR